MLSLGDRVIANNYLVRVKMDLNQAVAVMREWPEMPEPLRKKIGERSLMRMVDYGRWQAWAPASVLRALQKTYTYITRSDRYHRMPDGLKLPVTGFISQSTMCQDGRTNYNYEEGADFRQYASTPAYRVAYHIKRVPILCYPYMLQPTQGATHE